jgi:hypothetical protein
LFGISDSALQIQADQTHEAPFFFLHDMKTDIATSNKTLSFIHPKRRWSRVPGLKPYSRDAKKDFFG